MTWTVGGKLHQESDPFRNAELVVKSDTTVRRYRALRVYVASADAPATLVVTPLDNDVNVTLTFPAGITYDPMGVKKVLSSESTANAIVHGEPE